MSGKIHLENHDIVADMPSWMKHEMYENNEDGAACGYVRKRTTKDKSKVTCKLCLREMKGIDNG